MSNAEQTTSIESNGYWDITYITPVGIQGTHFAVEAETLEEAMKKCPVMLSYGTPWSPEEFTAVSGCVSTNVPVKTPA